MKIEEHVSPEWGTTTKLVVSLVVIVATVAVVLQFKNFVAPLIFAFLLSYLVHPILASMSNRLHLSWRAATTIFYLTIVLVLLGLLAWGGFSLIQPLQSLLSFMQKMLGDVPGFFANLTSKPLIIGTWSIDLSKFHNTNLWAQLQSILSPALAKSATLLADIAAGAASILTLTVFSLLISFFLTVESTGVRSELIHLNVPKFQDDIDRFSRHISRIWNSYLRGQLVVIAITVVVYTILLSVLGVKYAFGLALLAGMARFVPYVGPLVAWTTYGLVCIFQGSSIFGLAPLPYALLTIGCALITDVILDNFVSPRIMSNAVGVHPAVVLISVLIGAKWLGMLGVLIAAPAVASLQLLLTYIFRKLTDQDPWKDIKMIAAPVPMKLIFAHWLGYIAKFFKAIGRFVSKLFTNKLDNPQKNHKEKPNA